MPTRTPALAVLLTLALVACAGDDPLNEGLSFEAPETAVAYEVVLTGLPTEEMTELARQTLAVYRRQEDGANSVPFLRRRAESDRAVLQKLLRSRGYYQGEIGISVSEVADPAAPEAPDPTTPAAGPAPDPTPDPAAPPEDAAEAGEASDPPVLATVTIEVTPGPVLTLASHDLVPARDDDRLPPLDAAEMGSPVGRAAEAAPIVAAETEARVRLRRSGFPYAETGRRRAVADLETGTMEIDTVFDPGPYATFGATGYQGLQDVCPRYLSTYLPWQQGEVFDDTALRDFQLSLLGTDLFDTVRVEKPQPPPEDALDLPVTVVAEERPFRTVSAGARFNTDTGPSVTAGFEHRNLFCENETLTVRATAGLQLQELRLGYREPQYLRPSQDLIGGLVLRHEEDDAFDETSVAATLGIERRLSRRWVVGAGGLIEASQITENGVEKTALLGGIPTFAAYDRTDDPLDPTRGERLRVDVTPFAGSFDGDFAGFLAVDATGSLYYDVTDEKKYILAGRARLGTIIAEDVAKVPPTRRLYSGGGGSVRGYAQRFVGPLDAENDPTGGLSVAELGGEVRARLFGDIGGVAFVEAGSVSEDAVPNLAEGVQVAAGLGLRYYSPAGPIRLDVAFPLNGRDADDAFQFYFSIGQAF